MLDINTLQNAAEIIQYDSPDIPYTIQSRKLSNFTDMRALCHWHYDIEIIYVFDGDSKISLTYLLSINFFHSDIAS